jgi:hypothetical protein
MPVGDVHGWNCSICIPELLHRGFIGLVSHVLMPLGGEGFTTALHPFAGTRIERIEGPWVQQPSAVANTFEEVPK